MISFVGRLTVRAENAPAFEALLTRVRDLSRANEPGVVYYDFGRSADEPDSYVVLEMYRDAAAHAAHMDAAWVREAIPESRRLVEGGFDVAQYVSAGTAPAVRRMEETEMSAPAGSSAAHGLSDVERLIELQAIHELKSRRDHAVDRKDWDYYASVHTDDFVAMSIGPDPIVGGRAAADAIARQLANVTTVHHCHTPVIEFQDRDNATGVWAMEDNLFWLRDGEKQWLRGFGFYHETYVKGGDGKWRFSYRRLDRTHAETSPGAASLAVDVSGENPLVGAG